MAAPYGEALPQEDPTRLRTRDGPMRGSRDNWDIFWLIVLSTLMPPVAVLCVTSCDTQFALNVVLGMLTLGIGSIIHAIWVVCYYGKGGHLSWGQRRKLEQQRIAGALAIQAKTRPPQVYNEADADAAGYGGSKYL
ncbi:hypothetical protein KVR01_010654 [Diaporthe batatas]|uniref:uncharacterized protein n=1 Tax=Diaporthe batatas TaxID=748121 RepID=UPI001D056960|nr:uncharacterized protein KVR01_010654 [Diaporthe batatas]KAG8160017.1 hypothetical protein KVR01_010654 [Diaporthe batatas]